MVVREELVLASVFRDQRARGHAMQAKLAVHLHQIVLRTGRVQPGDMGRVFGSKAGEQKPEEGKKGLVSTTKTD